VYPSLITQNLCATQRSRSASVGDGANTDGRMQHD
jgi:hypothetical protein